MAVQRLCLCGVALQARSCSVRWSKDSARNDSNKCNFAVHLSSLQGRLYARPIQCSSLSLIFGVAAIGP